MAAHDDKISNNRRKLFKALSAAPVVMTLRPGAALANASALQCAADLRELAAPEVLESVPQDCEGEVCQVNGALYRRVTYWLWNDKQTVRPFHRLRKFFDGAAVVQMPAIEGGEFRDITGGLVPSSDHPELDLETDPLVTDLGATTPPALKVFHTRNGNRRLAITIPGNFGLAAEVYAEGEGSLDRIGVFPEEKFGGGNPGDNQPMNGSCMHSFAVAAGTKTITNG